MNAKVTVPTVLEKSIEPGVIDKKLLQALIINQGPKGEAGRLFRRDGIILKEVKEIRIEFLYILNIDHLWVMPNLVKLKLSNNIIEKIEHLSALIHLKELDLSFNNIKVIENLNELTKLEILLLYNNHISVLDGLDNLQNLTIISVGKNEIEDWEHVLYLRKFRNLRSLNMSENPCTGKEGYLDYLFAFVPQLVYYHYRMITNDERKAAVEKHERAIMDREENEAKIMEEINKRDALIQHAALLTVSFVEYLDEDNFFQLMYSQDEEGKGLTTINDDTQNAFEGYRKRCSAICNELHEIGMKEYEKRSLEISLFNNCVNTRKDAVVNSARSIIRELVEMKIQILAEVKYCVELLKEETEISRIDDIEERAEQLSEEFNNSLSKVWTTLMSQEVFLHEQIEDVCEVFRVNMTEMVESCLENAQSHFTQLRNLESEYNDEIEGIALYFITGLGDDIKIPAHLQNVCLDKDMLNNNIAASHDTHVQAIDNREDSMLSGLRNWFAEYIKELSRQEAERHRLKVLEISHFLECQRKDYEANAGFSNIF